MNRNKIYKSITKILINKSEVQNILFLELRIFCQTDFNFSSSFLYSNIPGKKGDIFTYHFKTTKKIHLGI